MGFMDQLTKLKDNWLLIVLFVVGFLMLFFVMAGGSSFTRMASTASYSSMDKMAYYPESNYGGGYYSNQNNNLAPNVLERIIVKTASLSVTVTDWEKSETDLKSYIKSNDAIVTTENVNTQYSKYQNGYYTINVPVDKYDALVNQLKGLGTIQSFNENANDITGSYVNLKDIIAAEKSRLESYEKLYNSTTNLADKKSLLDSIYSQKNTIRSLEYQLENKNDKIDYSQISFTMQEKRPTHANVVFATFSDLWSAFKQSLNVMLYLIAYLLPFALLWLLVWVIIKIAKRT